jgi:hypothetical protein
MTPGALHPIEARARDLALMLLGVTAPDARHVAASIFLKPIALDLMDRGNVTPSDTNAHCGAILARAEAIGRMGEPVPERRPNDGLVEFLEMGTDRIAMLMR